MEQPTRKREHRKRRFIGYLLFALTLCVFAFSFSIGESYAWLFGRNSASNIVNSPLLSVQAEESDNGTVYDGWTPADINWQVPVPKFTRFANTGQASVVIRVSYAEYWIRPASLVNGTPSEYLSNLFYNGTSYVPVATPQWSPVGGLFDTNIWTKDDDGWFYYRYPLAPGEVTADIINAVSFLPEAETAYAGAEYVLAFRVEAVQYSTNEINQNQLAAWLKFGRTYTDTNGLLTWSNTAP